MSSLSILPINVDALLHYEGVESARVELKASWDEKTTGLQVLHTICAFANDFQNLNGGYIIIGVEERDAIAVLPPKGLSEPQLEEAQKWIRGQCNRFEPTYMPIFSPEKIDDRWILVIWAQGGQERPYQAPEHLEKGGERRYYVRIGTETVDCNRIPNLKTQLMQVTARRPFDDRRATEATVNDIHETIVRSFLRDVRSGLSEEPNAAQVYRHLRIAEKVNGHDAPLNIALLMFSQNPTQWFRYAYIEVVQFANQQGDLLEEKRFWGMPLHELVRQTLSYLELSLGGRQIRKPQTGVHAEHWVSYPLFALREALVNAVYHRSYEPDQAEPVKIYLYPDRIEIISYPGPVPGITKEHLLTQTVPPVPARNRRIGEFLKELRLAEMRGTGIAKLYREMEKNGSSPPQFDFDENRTWFRVTLPAHPEYQAILQIKTIAQLRAQGDKHGAYISLVDAYRQTPQSLALTEEMVRYYIESHELDRAEEVCLAWLRQKNGRGAALILLLANAYIDHGNFVAAQRYLDHLLPTEFLENIEWVEAAITEKRAKRFPQAAKYFERAGAGIERDPKALHEFAQIKIKFAKDARPHGPSRQRDWYTHNNLLDSAINMLQKVVMMDVTDARKAWAYYDLGRAFKMLRRPYSEIADALEKALRLNPTEQRFQEELKTLQASSNQASSKQKKM